MTRKRHGKSQADRECESWSDELKSHEHLKRRQIHDDLLKGPPARMDQSKISHQERMFDPLLQRFRNPEVEYQHQTMENRELVKYLNRALDVDIMRNGNNNIVSMESRTAPLEKKVETRSCDVADVNTMAMPQTMVDYNIISNLSTEHHHWAKPEDRPRCVQRDPRIRKIQASQLRDFNIVSNRYLTNHEEKMSRDVMLNSLEVAYKYAHGKHVFDPIMQKFNSAEHEERQHLCDDAREVEVAMRKDAVEPPTNAGRVTKYYDMITHMVNDDGAPGLQLLDTLEKQRKSRYSARHAFDHEKRLREVQMEDGSANQRHDFVAHERWEETTKRGYNVVTNRPYGDGPRFEKLYEPFTVPRLTTWEKVEQDRSGLTPPPSGGSRGNSGQRTSEQTPRAYLPPKLQSTPRESAAGTPRTRATPRTLSEAGNASLGSARGRPPLLAMSGKPVSAPPPPPPLPGSPVGSVYSQPKM